MQKFFLIGLCLFSCWVEAKEVLPSGCKPIVVTDSLVTIPSGKPRLITLHNLTTTDLWVTHPLSKGDISSSLSSRIQADRWSVLKMNAASFTLSCIESKPGHEQQVSCQHVLSVCEWPTLKNIRKTDIFWIAENMALSPLIAYTTRKGWMTPLDKVD